MDYLPAMRVYVRVVERGSMTAAGRDLGIGQSAVSERIERLEAHLGQRLLYRNTRASTPTEAGRQFYLRCKRALDAADEALSGNHDTLPLRGWLRLAAPHGLGETLLPPLLLALRQSHPELKIELLLNDRLVDPTTEGVDISLRLGPPGIGHFVVRRLGQVTRVLVAAPTYLQRHGMPQHPEELSMHGFARVAGLFQGGRLPLLTADGQRLTADIDVAMTLSHVRPLHAILLGGGAIGVLQTPVCREDLAQGRLVRLLPDHTVPSLELHALYLPNGPLPARVRTVLEWLEQALPKMLASDTPACHPLHPMGDSPEHA